MEAGCTADVPRKWTLDPGIWKEAGRQCRQQQQEHARCPKLTKRKKKHIHIFHAMRVYKSVYA